MGFLSRHPNSNDPDDRIKSIFDGTYEKTEPPLTFHEINILAKLVESLRITHPELIVEYEIKGRQLIVSLPIPKTAKISSPNKDY